MTEVALIAAVGRHGQIGLKGALPWRDPEDLRFFKERTMGQVVVVGMNTYATLPPLPGRIVVPYAGEPTPEEFLDRLKIEHPDKTIWIAGGAKTYAVFLPFVRRSVITHVPYDGEADTYMPHLW